MTPTPAQIEAAAEAMRTFDNLCVFGEPYVIGVAKAALTAAAEIDRQRSLVCREAIAATIERCAQVADVCGYEARHIAAAIRALKDKP